MQVDVAIGVGLPQMAVGDFLTGVLQLAVAVEAHCRHGRRGTARVETILPRYENRRHQPLAREGLRMDGRTGFRQNLVATGVLPVPVRVERSGDTTRAGL